MASNLKQELIEAIQNEELHFGMRQWKIGRHNRYATPATCNTASCMAGHIEALRPELAKKLAPKHTSTYVLAHTDHKDLDHEALAQEIWELETDTKCRLDFCGLNYDNTYGDSDLDQITRKEAIAHIKGRSKKWPLLPKDSE